ncbi:hypothetical protein DPMN_072811 [Dreissena polymorpha]|uniref:Uncharacterized protein n=1 Tax=Dreissena polymorpha TaxID=45954 RepID=A0A9D4BY08_DREPO|nr:hypothetical protein DPMN_072811 [Dreissena polymorpha]
MATTSISDIAGIAYFDVGPDLSTLGFRWTRWLRSFELYTYRKDIASNAQRKALLLHSAGLEVQDICYALNCPDPESCVL